MVEYAIVLLVIRKVNHAKNTLEKTKPEVLRKEFKESKFRELIISWESKQEKAKKAQEDKEDFCFRLDQFSFFLFALLFLLFNIIYPIVFE